MRVPAVTLGERAAGEPGGVARAWIGERFERSRESADVFGVFDDDPRLANDLGGAVRPARHHRDSRRRSLEAHVRESVVASREHERVGRRVERLGVGAGTHEAHPLFEGEAPNHRLPGGRIVAAGDDEPCIAVPTRCERPERRAEPLSREPRACEEPERPAPGAEFGAQPRALPGASLRVEAIEVDAVPDHREPLGRDPVASRDGVADEARVAQHDLMRIAEDPPFDRELDRVPWREAAQRGGSRAVHPFEVVAVAASSGAEHVLVSCPREGLDDVEALRGSRGGPREGDHPKRRPARGRSDTTKRRSRRRLSRSRDHRHPVSGESEPRGHLPRDVLDAAASGSRALDHERDAERSARQIRCAGRRRRFATHAAPSAATPKPATEPAVDPGAGPHPVGVQARPRHARAASACSGVMPPDASAGPASKSTQAAAKRLRRMISEVTAKGSARHPSKARPPASNLAARRRVHLGRAGVDASGCAFHIAPRNVPRGVRSEAMARGPQLALCSPIDGGPASPARREKREAILEAAIEVFARCGYHRARVSDIAREAGIAYGLVYHYFKNKEEILSTIFEERWSTFLEALEAVERRDVPAREKLVSVAALILNAYRLRPAWVKVLVLEIQRSSRFAEPGQLRAVGALFQGVARILRAGQQSGELRRDLDPDIACTVFLGGLELALTSLVLELARPDAAAGGADGYYLRVAHTVVDVFLNGLAAGDAS